MLLPRKAKLTFAQQQIVDEAMASFMHHAPFFSYYFYDQMVDYPTLEIPMAATDGKRVFYNPEYLGTLKPMERCFVFAHETYHAVYKHAQRQMGYAAAKAMGDLPWDQDLFNRAADFVINADLVESRIGTCNSEWLYDPQIKGSELTEDVYRKLWKPPPPGGTPQPPCPPTPTGGSGQPQPGQGQPQQGQGQGQSNQPTTNSADPAQTFGKGRKVPSRDRQAEANGGQFDQVMDPHRDSATGQEDLPSEMEFREAITRAEAAAKRAGKLPGNLARVVKDILDPQVTWKEKLRLRVTGKIGARRENWDRANRRRLVLNPMIYLPSRQGYGAETIAIVIDNSGSVGGREMDTFFSEAVGIVAECRPKRVILMWVDYKLQRVDEARSLDELMHLREATGGGGTSFAPGFKHLEDERIKPDALIYLTDMCPGDGWPEDPGYPVFWCSTSVGIEGPFGETIEIKVGG